MKTWELSDISKPLYQNVMGGSFEEVKVFDVIITKKRVVFGGAYIAGFLESGYMERKPDESINDSLRECYDDLVSYYTNSKESVSRIVCNERM